MVFLIALRRLTVGNRDQQQDAELTNDQLDILSQETGASLWTINHDRKSEAQTAEARGIGSTMFSARVDATFDLSRAADGLRLVEAEARFKTEDRFFLKLESAEGGEVIRYTQDPESEKVSRLHERVAAGDSIRKAAKAAGIPYTTANRLLK